MDCLRIRNLEMRRIYLSIYLVYGKKSLAQRYDRTCTLNGKYKHVRGHIMMAVNRIVCLLQLSTARL